MVLCLGSVCAVCWQVQYLARPFCSLCCMYTAMSGCTFSFAQHYPQALTAEAAASARPAVAWFGSMGSTQANRPVSTRSGNLQHAVTVIAAPSSDMNRQVTVLWCQLPLLPVMAVYEAVHIAVCLIRHVGLLHTALHVWLFGASVCFGAGAAA